MRPHGDVRVDVHAEVADWWDWQHVEGADQNWRGWYLVLTTTRRAPQHLVGRFYFSLPLMACLHEAIVAAISRATDRRDDRLV